MFLSSRFLSAGPETAPAHFPFCLSHGLICLCVSLSASLCHAFAPLFIIISPSPPPPPPGTDSGEPISSRSCLLFATVNSASWENGLFSSLRAFSFGQLGSSPWNYFCVVVRRLICSRRSDTSVRWQWLPLSDYDNDIGHDATFGAFDKFYANTLRKHVSQRDELLLTAECKH